MPESRSNLALPIGSMVPGLQRGDVAIRPDRWCGCGKRLSQYNRGSRCYACDEKARQLRAPKPLLTCAGCGGPIHSLRATKWCSRDCQNAAIRARRHRVISKNCPVCHTAFTPTPNQRFCSPECRAHDYNERRRRAAA